MRLCMYIYVGGWLGWMLGGVGVGVGGGVGVVCVVLIVIVT